MVPFGLAEILLRPGFVPVIVTVRIAVCEVAAAPASVDLAGGGSAVAFLNWLTIVLWRAAWRFVVWSGVRGVRRRSMTILFLLIVVNFSKGRKGGLDDMGVFTHFGQRPEKGCFHGGGLILILGKLLIAEAMGIS
jgi:hypothetical protein